MTDIPFKWLNVGGQARKIDDVDESKPTTCTHGEDFTERCVDCAIEADEEQVELEHLDMLD